MLELLSTSFILLSIYIKLSSTRKKFTILFLIGNNMPLEDLQLTFSTVLLSLIRNSCGCVNNNVFFKII